LDLLKVSARGGGSEGLPEDNDALDGTADSTPVTHKRPSNPAEVVMTYLTMTKSFTTLGYLLQPPRGLIVFLEMSKSVLPESSLEPLPMR
jgi:hypothetical protein